MPSEPPSSAPALGATPLIARAMIRAVVVLPVPRGPQKRYACEILSCATAF